MVFLGLRGSFLGTIKRAGESCHVIHHFIGLLAPIPLAKTLLNYFGFCLKGGLFVVSIFVLFFTISRGNFYGLKFLPCIYEDVAFQTTM